MNTFGSFPIPKDRLFLDLSELLKQFEQDKKEFPGGKFREVTTENSYYKTFARELREVLMEPKSRTKLFASVSLLEFTIFDPSDDKEGRFFTLLEGNTSEVLKNYEEELRGNLNSARRERGPLIPDPALYDNAGWWMIFKGKKAENRNQSGKFHRAGWFSGDGGDAPHSAFEPDAAKSGPFDIKKFLRSFAEKVGNKSVFTENQKSGTRHSVFLLVPFSRPSRLKASSELHRGGGLFIFGTIKAAPSKLMEQVAEISMKLSRILSDAVLRFSHDKVDAALGKKIGYNQATGNFAHQIRQVAAGVGDNWLVSQKTWETARSELEKDPNAAEGLANYKIAPAPSLYRGLRKALSLWAQNKRWQELFPDDFDEQGQPFAQPGYPVSSSQGSAELLGRPREPSTQTGKLPNTLMALIETAYDYAKGLQVVGEYRGANFEVQWEKLPEFWNGISKMEGMKKELKLIVSFEDECVSPSIFHLAPPPEKEDKNAPPSFYSRLCNTLRLFVAIFDNYLLRGDETEGVTIATRFNTKNEAARIEFCISNKKSTIPRRDESNLHIGKPGRDVILDLGELIEAPVTWPDDNINNPIFEVKFALPLTIARGGPAKAIPLWLHRPYNSPEFI